MAKTAKDRRMPGETLVSKDTWRDILKCAYEIFDDLERRHGSDAPFSLGGGTVLMFHYKHRLSKDIDLFGYDAQRLSLVSPRLNETSAAMASEYVEQANSVKIVLPQGDIDFVIAADVTSPVKRSRVTLAGRDIDLDPPEEILAKKMFYHAATFQPRDVYDVSAAIDLAPASARAAVDAARTKAAILLQRLDTLRALPMAEVLSGILPYDRHLEHADDMVQKVFEFIRSCQHPGGDGRQAGRASGAGRS